MNGSTANPAGLAPKTIRNFYISLSAFFTWAGKELELPNPLKSVSAPQYEDAPVWPFSKEQVKALGAINHIDLRDRWHCRTSDTRRPR